MNNPDYRREISKDLKELIKDLEPSKDFKDCGHYAIDAIYKSLQANSAASGLYSVNRIVMAGSVGKGTVIADTDFDIVVFLNHDQPPFSQQLVDAMAGALVSIPGYSFRFMNRRCIRFTLQFRGTEYNIDLLPASNYISSNKLTELQEGSSEQAIICRKQMKKYYAKYGNGHCFSSSLAEQTCLFLRKRPKPVVQVIKLARHWNNQIEEYMKMPTVTGRSYMIEVIAVNAQRNRAACSLMQRFVRFLLDMKRFAKLSVVLGYHYNKSSIPAEVLTPKPVVLDPINQYNNIASGIDPEAVQIFMNCARLTLHKISNAEPWDALFDFSQAVEE